MEHLMAVEQRDEHTLVLSKKIRNGRDLAVIAGEACKLETAGFEMDPLGFSFDSDRLKVAFRMET
jgi:hypothetical protein